MDAGLKRLDRDGMVLVPGALDGEQLAVIDAAHRRVVAQEPGGAVHLPGFLGRDPAFVELLDHPAVFPLVWGSLGWNIQMYHCHLDHHPPAAPAEEPWRWHQDGGRQNVDVESDPRPRLSVKVAWFLSDVSAPGRGNMLVLPGSHRRNRLARRRGRPPGAVEVLAAPGDALVFDRRLWHARSDNRSPLDRRALFLAYTYRWIRQRDELIPPPAEAALTPVRRQLVGLTSAAAIGHWIPADEDVPLRALVEAAPALG